MSQPILVTGANGYIAGQLIPSLLQKGYGVRCLARDPARLAGRSWAAAVEIVPADLLRPEALAEAMLGIRTAYYLIHSMSSGRRYPERDLRAARNFAAAAEAAGLEHVIYLGGLADPDGPLSPHMRSRIETGQALRSGRVPVTEFRAGVIIGPGSISFEMIRYITEQFPILVGPRWLRNLSQPIATKDVLSYLLAALDTPACRGQVVEIGGADVMTYVETMLAYARQRGLNRRFLAIPFAPIGLMAWMVGLLTPVPPAIARPLIEGLQDPSIVRTDTARILFPELHPVGCQAALVNSLACLTPASVEPLYDPALPAQTLKQEGFLLDVRQVSVAASPAAVFNVLTGLGGQKGWLYADWLWRARGLLDRLLGGPGLRGRPEVLGVGDSVDFYRVEVLQNGHCLRLRSELKAPGQGWMEWRLLPEVKPMLLVQIAWFAPRGVWGFLYWHLLGPVHRGVFAGLFKRIARSSMRTR
ncbi:MAG: DUF2867 domain-containing protein [Chloroflexi bacterium]|nr:DUF2867 domain-containing protein [Chloroflexota bacterium]